MAEGIKAKLELVTSTVGGMGQGAIGGDKAFKKALSLEKFKAAKSITSGNLGKILIGGIIAGITAGVSSADTTGGEGEGGESSEGKTEEQLVESIKENIEDWTDKAKEEGKNLEQFKDGTILLTDDTGKVTDVLERGKVAKEILTAKTVLHFKENIPAIPKFILDVGNAVNSLIDKIKGAVGGGSSSGGGTVAKPPTPKKTSNSNAPTQGSFPWKQGVIKYGGVYNSPPVSGGNYPIVDLERTNDILNQDIINSWIQD